TTPHGTDLSLISNVFALASGATSSPASGENVDFSTNSTNKYTVTYSDGSSEMFDITVVNREPSMADMMIAEDIFTDFKIIKLGIYLSDVTPTFDDNDITVNIPYYIDLSDLKNTFTLHPDVDSFDISSGDEIDFSAPNNTRQYNVTYSDNSSETINITITSNQNITSVATYYVVFKQMYDGRVVTSPPLLPSIPYKTDISEITNFTVISDTFSQLPPGLSKHGVFEYIEVSNFNSVHLYENSFKGLIDLMALIIHDNTTISIDENTLNGLTNLMSLKIYDNTTISIDENTLNGLTNLKLLDLSNNNLTSIHENSFNFLTNLDELNLSNNNLLSIPTDLFNVSTNLRNLNLSNNDFTSIPTDSFTSSVNLRVLRLYNNLITSIPDDSLSTLSGLESLDLSFNEISDISENVFSELLSLKTLILNDNDIPSIPSNLSSSLERMHLNWNNRLYCLPQEIWNINIPQLFYGNTGISGPGDVNCNIPN
ncbi:MAG: leucine-rich repeat domain-containing protein, partial [Flavobacteriaceae bacterium]|nr:leucine-rich repeat domain-containing protein [Flavobacteriaceae bacterium]